MVANKVVAFDGEWILLSQLSAVLVLVLMLVMWVDVATGSSRFSPFAATTFREAIATATVKAGKEG